MGAEGKCILLVEDDTNDTFFLRFAFEKAGIANPLHAVTDGQEAIDYFSGTGQWADRDAFPIPSLVLLDLKLPVKSGFEFLEWLRARPQFAAVVVLVLTSSSDQKDIEEAYRLGASSFVVKPLTVEKRIHLARLIKEYWIELNLFPGLLAKPKKK